MSDEEEREGFHWELLLGRCTAGWSDETGWWLGKVPQTDVGSEIGMFAARKSCPNIFAGIYSTEEVQHFKSDQSSGQGNNQKGSKDTESAKDAILADLKIPEGKTDEVEEKLTYLQMRKGEINSKVDEDRTQLSYDTVTDLCRMKASEWEMSMNKADWHDFCVFLNEVKSSYPKDVQSK